MFIIIGIMLTGMLFGYLLRSKRLMWIHKIITFLIWVLLFLLGIDVGGNDIIVKGLHTLGLEALIGSGYRQHIIRLGALVLIVYKE